MEVRPERQEGAGTAAGTSPNRTIIYILAAVALVLAAVLAYIAWSRHTLVKELNAEKAELQEQMVALQKDYEGLSSDYESINAQLDSSKEEVNLLIERLQKTEATNRRLIRKYQKELGTLRSIMKNYVKQIDSLNTLNHKLTVDAAQARKEARNARAKSEELQKTVNDLSGKVETGSIIRARGFKAVALNKSTKEVQRAQGVAKVKVDLTLSENPLAPTGPVRIYVVLKDSDGNLVSGGEKRVLELDGQTIAASASREVDYQGADLDLSIYVNNVESYAKGFYTVEIYSERGLLGKTEFMLR